jgi:tetratricopeptide (TPR) repeat protein
MTTGPSGARPRLSTKEDAWLVANTLIAAGEFEAAIGSLSRVIELDGGDAEAYYSRGVMLSELERNDEALRDLSRAIERDGKVADYWARRGVANWELGDLDAAVADVSRAIEIEDLAEYREARAEFLEALGRASDASADLARARELRPPSEGPDDETTKADKE